MVYVACFEIIAASCDNNTEQINTAWLNAKSPVVTSLSTQGYARIEPSVSKTMKRLEASVWWSVGLPADQPDCDAANYLLFCICGYNTELPCYEAHISIDAYTEFPLLSMSWVSSLYCTYWLYIRVFLWILILPCSKKKLITQIFILL